MNRHLVAVAFVFALSSVALGAAAPTISALTAEIDSVGARQTIATLARDREWDAVVDRIGSGNAAWISIAAKLAPGGDAGSAEDIGIGLATALPRNPGAVLAVIGTGAQTSLSVQRVCSVPFVEMAMPDVAAYRKRATSALQSIVSPMLRQRRDDCLAALKT